MDFVVLGTNLKRENGGCLCCLQKTFVELVMLGHRYFKVKGEIYISWHPGIFSP